MTPSNTTPGERPARFFPSADQTTTTRVVSMIPEQLVDRMHRVLIAEIRGRRPEYLAAPFTVAEIYQDLVPYRTHRDKIGAAMNGDYEHALLQLLAGERDYLRIESEAARQRMAEELGSSNPNTGLFREFAALDVRLNPALIPTQVTDEPGPSVVGSAADPPETAPPPAGASPPPEAPQASGAVSDDRSVSGVEEASPVGVERSATTGAAGGAESNRAPAAASPSVELGQLPENCRWCREVLPRRATLRYCPFCGVDVNLVPCPSCGEELERGWRFCIACGTDVITE